ncbi:MAG TPA: SDR family oxidoreductase [Pseudorhodoplanes sp.]|nr:SDR family oxidoreductase [Pseudorhodoplanes sp.]
MTGRLAGKKAMVTGAAQGLGAAIAEALAKEGARVLLTDLNEAGVFEQRDRLDRKFGPETAYAIRHDVTSEEDWVAAVECAQRDLGGLSVLVNNAGIVLTGSVQDFELEAWRKGMAVNVDSVFIGCKLALPLMHESQPASIINLSSIAGLIASHNFANYNASKAAVWLLTKSVALHCARRGWDIRCNSVHPAFIKTPILSDLVGDKNEQEVMEKLARQVPLGRLGEPSDIAHAVVYLAADESRFMTAAELKLDGGISAM